MPNSQSTRTMNDVTTPSVDRLDERITHIVRAVDEIKTTMQGLATRAEIAALVSRSEHSASVAAMETRIQTLESKLAESSGRSRLTLIREVAVTIAALGAAGVLVVNLVHLFDKVPK